MTSTSEPGASARSDVELIQAEGPDVETSDSPAPEGAEAAASASGTSPGTNTDGSTPDLAELHEQDQVRSIHAINRDE